MKSLLAPFLTLRRSLAVVPQDALTFRFARSSGPGGQHVNKVNTKVDARFVLNDATWLTELEKQTIAMNNPGRLNSRGELYITSQRYRSQAANKEDCVQKLQNIVDAAQTQSPLFQTDKTRQSTQDNAGLIFSSDKSSRTRSQDNARQGQRRKNARQGQNRTRAGLQGDHLQRQRQKRLVEVCGVRLGARGASLCCHCSVSAVEVGLG